ncbi:MAG: TonB-dependent receptor [Porticoccaceae bacterium]
MLKKRSSLKKYKNLKIRVVGFPDHCVSSIKTGALAVSEPKPKLIRVVRLHKSNSRLRHHMLALALLVTNVAVAQGNKVCDLDFHETSLVDALNELVRQCSMQAIYPLNLVSEENNYSLEGRYRISDALQKILDGSGLSGQVTGNGYVIVLKKIKENDREKEMKKLKIPHFITTILAGISALSSGAYSQEDQSYKKSASIEEIVVVATKREKSIQEVPITVTAVTAQGLEKSGIQGIATLGQVVPSLNVSQTAGANVMFIRGIGTNLAAAGNEPSVATFVDGVYSPVPRTGAIYGFNNVERVEVLKGPQGTLFGRNATGGLVHIITKEPSNEPTAKLRIGYGNYDTYEANFYGSLGISQNAAGDVALYYKDQGRSPIDNPLEGKNFVPENNFSWRSKLLVTPNDDLSIRIIGYYADFESSQGSIRQPLPGAFASTGLGYSGDFFKIANEFVGYTTVESKGVSAQFDYSLSNFDLVSITSYGKDEAVTYFDGDGSAAFIQTAVNPILSETLTQEIRIESKKSESLEWITGVYLYKNKSSYDPFRISSPTVELVGYSKQIVEAWAVFGEVRWEFLDETGLSVGLRWNQDDIEMSGITYANGVSSIGSYEQEDDFGELSYRIGLDHQIEGYGLIYANYSRGFKTGVYNLINVGQPGPALEPEVLDALEIGYKSRYFYDGRVRVNASAFWYDFKDLQLVTVSTTSLQSANAAKAEISGAEMEFEFQATEDLWVAAGVAYLDSEYKDYLGLTNRPRVDSSGRPVGGNIANIPADFSGNELTRAPDLTYNLSAVYVIPVYTGDLSFSLSYFYNNGFYWDPENRLEEPSYGVLNAEVSWSSYGNNFKFALWGRNITNEKYSVYTNNSPPSSDAYGPSDPVMYGFYLDYSFF